MARASSRSSDPARLAILVLRKLAHNGGIVPRDGRRRERYFEALVREVGQIGTLKMRCTDS